VLTKSGDSPKSGFDWIDQLAIVLVQRTGGNAFFIMQMILDLAEKLVIRFDWKERQWSCSPIATEQVASSVNVVEFVVKQMRTLPKGVQSLLAVLALFGSEVPHGLLPFLTDAVGLEKDNGCLDIARQVGVLSFTQAGDVLFLHDRFQEAAAQLTTDPCFVRLRISQALLQFLNLHDMKDPALLENNLVLSFSLVNHLMAAESLIPSESKMLLQLKSLAKSAAEVSLRQSAYEKSVAYWRCAVRLEKDPIVQWRYRLKLAQGAWLARLFDEARDTLGLLEDTAPDNNCLIDAKVAGISFNALRENYSVALQKGAEALYLLDGTVLKVDTGKEELKEFVEREVFQRISDSGKSASELFSVLFPTLDAKRERFDKIVCSLTPTCFLLKKMYLYTLLGGLGVARCLEDKCISSVSASCLAIFAFGTSFTLNERKRSHELGFGVALPLLRRRSGAVMSLDCVVPVCVGILAHWGPNISEGLPLLSEVRKEL
jgi:hypothetical protein